MNEKSLVDNHSFAVGIKDNLKTTTTKKNNNKKKKNNNNNKKKKKNKTKKNNNNFLLYWLSKLWKRPYKARLNANSGLCTTIEIYKLLTSSYSLLLKITLLNIVKMFTKTLYEFLSVN